MFSDVAGHSARLEGSGVNTASSGGAHRTKRPYAGSISGRPSKLPKTFHDNSLREHLPEVSLSILDHETASTPSSTFYSRVMDQARHENSTIVVLPSLKSASDMMACFLQWSVDNERERRLNTSYRPRTAFLVVEHNSTSTDHLGILNKEMPSASVGVCTKASVFNKSNHLLKKDVFIIQSQVLLDVMTQGNLHMDQINALVIGDIEPIRELDCNPSLPIVQIMNTFYRSCAQSSLPRILALSLSGDDRWTLYDSKILKLEATLHCKVLGLTAERRRCILTLPERPNETVILYEPSTGADETTLFKQLHLLDPEEIYLRRLFKVARYAQIELGSCAADLVLRQTSTKIGSITRHGNGKNSSNSVDDIEVAVRNIIKNSAFTLCNLDPTSPGYNVTHKFRRLVEVLQSSEPYGEAFRAVIFVRRRVIAVILYELLQNLEDKLRFVRPCVLTGRDSTSGIQHLLEVFDSFSSGKYSVLIATKSVEDFDIPKTNIVIRYDVFDSQTSVAFSRACTRGRESHLIHMIERGNHFHRRILSNITNLDAGTLRWSETLRSSLENSIPPVNLYESGEAYRSESEDEDIGGSSDKYVEDPITGGRIYVEDAVTVTFRFAARWSKDNSDNMLVIGLPSSTLQDDFACRISLSGSPIDGLLGSPSPSKACARRSVCFKACQKLSNCGLLDCSLFPTTPTPSVGNTTGLMPLNADGKEQSPTGLKSYSRKQPDFWRNTAKFSLKTLHPTVVYVSHRLDGVKSYAPVVIFARRSIPNIPAFSLFLSGVPVPLKFYCYPAVNINELQLDLLHRYTLRIYRAIINKPWSCLAEELLCFFAPLRYDWIPPSSSYLEHNIIADIHWDAVHTAASNWAVPIDIGSSSSIEHELEDSIVLDRWVEFTRRYEFVRLRTDMTPMSKDPSEQSCESLLESYIKRRKEFDGLKDNNQPILEVYRVPALANHLNPTFIRETSAANTFLIPELCARFTVSASIMRTALLLPSILRRINDLLLVKEVNAKLFRHHIREDLLHMALCTPSAGGEYDYERLEFLGDGFLKYLASVYTFATYPSQTEGMLHQTRQKLISNKALLSRAGNIGLPAYIQSKPFVVKGWYLPTLKSTTLEVAKTSITPPRCEADVCEDRAADEFVGHDEQSETRTKSKKKKNKRNKSDTEMCHWLGDKTIADVTEAILGAAYISGGRDAGLQVAKALSLPIVDVDQWSDLGRKMPLTPTQQMLAKIRIGSIEAVETIIGCQFARPHIAVQALTQSLIPGYEITSFERLEFIGDAILDIMVVRYIFDREQHLSPGGLTLLKAAMVSNSALAAVCVSSGLYEHFQPQDLAKNVGDYVSKVKTRQKQAYKLAQEEGRSPGQYWYDIEPPKVLSDLIESLIGAIYISNDCSPRGPEALFDNVLKPFYDKHITIQTLSHHPTKTLLELLQATGCVQFKIEKERIDNVITRCNVVVHDVVLVSAEGPTATNAVKMVSILGLDALEGDPEFMKRTCDCRMHGKKAKRSSIEDTLSKLES